MTANKSERLLNLLILLLVARTYVPKDRIRDAVAEYRSQRSDEAFEKMFERDKDELRALGIPVEVASADAYFDDEPGYRVKRDAFELPDLRLEPDEAAVIGLAARVWQHAGLAQATSQALLKLKAAGLQTDREALDVVSPRLVADEPSFDALWQATQTQQQVGFDYRRSTAPQPRRRHLQPWGMVSALGRWYVVGFDVDRGDPRLFRLSRVVGEVAAEGAPGAYVVPEGTDIRALTRELQGDRTIGVATLRVRQDAAHDLRRRATSTTPEPGPPGEGWDRVQVEFASLDQLAGEVLAALDAAVVLEPAELRDLVLRRLGAVAEEVAP